MDKDKIIKELQETIDSMAQTNEALLKKLEYTKTGYIIFEGRGYSPEYYEIVEKKFKHPGGVKNWRG